MRRICLWLALACFPVLLFAQNPAADAANRAQQQRLEEWFNSINKRLEGIEEAQDSLRKRQEKITAGLQKLSAELEEQKRAHSLVNTNAVTQEQLKEMARTVKEIDDKRVEDNKLISKTLKELQNALLAPLPNASKTPMPTTPSSGAGDSNEYIVQLGDSPIKIRNQRNAELKALGLPPITLDELKAANPNINWEVIHPGQKIRWPQPAKK